MWYKWEWNNILAIFTYNDFINVIHDFIIVHVQFILVFMINTRLRFYVPHSKHMDGWEHWIELA